MGVGPPGGSPQNGAAALDAIDLDDDGPSGWCALSIERKGAGRGLRSSLRSPVLDPGDRPGHPPLLVSLEIHFPLAPPNYVAVSRCLTTSLTDRLDSVAVAKRQRHTSRSGSQGTPGRGSSQPVDRLEAVLSEIATATPTAAENLRLRDDLVQRARALEASWSQIARAADMTPQGTHAKWRSL